MVNADATVENRPAGFFVNADAGYDSIQLTNIKVAQRS